MSMDSGEDASPVTWHIALWVLLSLCSNSMAQPSGRLCGTPARHRLYLSSSPILCCADAICILFQTLTTMIKLNINPLQACSFIVQRRSEDQPRLYYPSSWPRWIFFIMGPLPAAIKLASFSGTPWTQVWGFMFLLSFNVIELVALLARRSEHDHIPPIRAESGDSEKLQIQLNRWLNRAEVYLFAIAILVHISVTLWAYATLWIPFITLIRSSDVVAWIKAGISLLMISVMIITPVIAYILRRSGLSDFQQRWLPLPKVLRNCIFIIMFHTILIPDKLRPSRAQKFHEMLKVDYIIGINWGFAAGFIFQWTMNRICSRYHRLGKVLLVGSEVTITKEGGEVEVIKKVNQEALATLSFFLVTIGLCTLWYAYQYDPEGSVHPAWIDVFG